VYFGISPPDNGGAKIYIGEDALPGIRYLPVGCSGEEVAGDLHPAGDGGLGEILLGGEVVEETALGHPGGAAEVVHGGAGVALLAEKA
jgi:hypothetical protein